MEKSIFQWLTQKPKPLDSPNLLIQQNTTNIIKVGGMILRTIGLSKMYQRGHSSEGIYHCLKKLRSLTMIKIHLGTMKSSLLLVAINKGNRIHPYSYKPFIGRSQRFAYLRSIQKFMAYGKLIRRICMRLRKVTCLLKQVMMTSSEKMQKKKQDMVQHLMKIGRYQVKEGP